MARKKGFSPNRVLGITKMKQKVAREIGFPTTKAGQQRKIKREREKMIKSMFGEGCLLPTSLMMIISILLIILAAS